MPVQGAPTSATTWKPVVDRHGAHTNWFILQDESKYSRAGRIGYRLYHLKIPLHRR